MGYYTAISILTWLALAVMCILVHENGRLRKEDKGGLYVAYALIAASAFAEWLAMMLDGVESLSRWPLMLAKCADYTLTPLAGGAIVKQMGVKSRLTKVLDALLTAHVMFQIAALFGGWMVEIDAHNRYHHGTGDGFFVPPLVERNTRPLFHHALYRRPPAAVNAAWTPWNAMATSAATPV